MNEYNLNDKVSLLDFDNNETEVIIIAIINYAGGTKDYCCVHLSDISNTKFNDWAFVLDRSIIQTFVTFNDPHTTLKYTNLNPYINKKYTWAGPKYIKSHVNHVVASKTYEFQNCKVCQERVDMAEPNQPDGTFVCWSCRNYPYRNSF